MFDGKPSGILNRAEPPVGHFARTSARDIGQITVFRVVWIFRDRSSNSRTKDVFDLLKKRWSVVPIDIERVITAFQTSVRIAFT